MTEATDNETKLTYETAIRSFTEAEVALREIVSALERYRAASDSVEAAEAVVSSSQAVLAAALATFGTTSVELASTATSLRDASTTIAALDPERFWSSFEELRSDAKTADDALSAKLEAVEADLSGEATRTREQVGAAIAEVRAVAMQARAAAAIGAVAAALAVVMGLTFGGGGDSRSPGPSSIAQVSQPATPPRGSAAPASLKPRATPTPTPTPTPQPGASDDPEVATRQYSVDAAVAKRRIPADIRGSCDRTDVDSAKEKVGFVCSLDGLTSQSAEVLPAIAYLFYRTESEARRDYEAWLGSADLYGTGEGCPDDVSESTWVFTGDEDKALGRLFCTKDYVVYTRYGRPVMIILYSTTGSTPKRIWELWKDWSTSLDPKFG